MILNDKEFNKISLYKRRILRKEIYSNENIKSYFYCPHCGSEYFIKFGKYDGIQRYRCKSCRKTFSNTTNSLWKYSKHPPDKWLAFVELLGENKTLDYCARSLEISIVTAFNWRHKVLHGIENSYKPRELKNLIFMEMNYSRKNYKGSRNKHFEYSNDFNKRYNICAKEVYTVISYDVNDSIIIKTVGFAGDWEDGFKKHVYSYCNEESYIHINPIFARQMHNYVINHNKRLTYKVRKNYDFNSKSYYVMDNIKCKGKISKMSVQLSKWIGGFRGVATKYLNHYCSLFALNFVDKMFDYMSIFFNLLSECPYTSINDIKLNHLENY